MDAEPTCGPAAVQIGLVKLAKRLPQIRPRGHVRDSFCQPLAQSVVRADQDVERYFLTEGDPAAPVRVREYG